MTQSKDVNRGNNRGEGKGSADAQVTRNSSSVKAEQLVALVNLSAPLWSTVFSARCSAARAKSCRRFPTSVKSCPSPRLSISSVGPPGPITAGLSVIRAAHAWRATEL